MFDLRLSSRARAALVGVGGRSEKGKGVRHAWHCLKVVPFQTPSFVLVIPPASFVQLREFWRVKAAMAREHGKHVNSLLSHTVDNAVGAQKHFPDILSLQFGDHAARVWGGLRDRRSFSRVLKNTK